MFSKNMGILSSPNPKGGMTLLAKTEVKTFYLSDVISRVMPGKKNFVSVLVKECINKRGYCSAILGKPTMNSRYTTMD